MEDNIKRYGLFNSGRNVNICKLYLNKREFSLFMYLIIKIVSKNCRKIVIFFLFEEIVVRIVLNFIFRFDKYKI